MTARFEALEAKVAGLAAKNKALEGRVAAAEAEAAAANIKAEVAQAEAAVAKAQVAALLKAPLPMPGTVAEADMPLPVPAAAEMAKAADQLALIVMASPSSSYSRFSEFNGREQAVRCAQLYMFLSCVWHSCCHLHQSVSRWSDRSFLTDLNPLTPQTPTAALGRRQRRQVVPRPRLRAGGGPRARQQLDRVLDPASHVRCEHPDRAGKRVDVFVIVGDG